MVKFHREEAIIWTGIRNQRRFSNCKSGVEILNRRGCHPLDRALRSAQHCPAQSLLQHLSHAELQRQSERHSVIAFLVVDSISE